MAKSRYCQSARPFNLCAACNVTACTTLHYRQRRSRRHPLPRECIITLYWLPSLAQVRNCENSLPGGLGKRICTVLSLERGSARRVCESWKRLSVGEKKGLHGVCGHVYAKYTCRTWTYMACMSREEVPSTNSSLRSRSLGSCHNSARRCWWAARCGH